MSQNIPEQIKLKSVLAIQNGDQSVINVKKTLGVSRSTIYRWIERYAKTGELKRMESSGRPPKIDIGTGKKLLKIIKKKATKYGFESDFWTTRRIQQVLKKELKIKVSRSSVGRSLKKFEYSYRKPESRYYETSSKKQREWRKKTVPKINRLVRKHKAILYFEDESCIQLSPVCSEDLGANHKRRHLVVVMDQAPCHVTVHQNSSDFNER